METAGSSGTGAGYEDNFTFAPVDYPEPVIPTALTIKNIPIQFPEDQFKLLFKTFALPEPYAFNYHYHRQDNLFRGMAFANFRSSEDAQAVLEQLNGLEVEGRRIRVENKKQQQGNNTTTTPQQQQQQRYRTPRSGLIEWIPAVAESFALMDHATATPSRIPPRSRSTTSTSADMEVIKAIMQDLKDENASSPPDQHTIFYFSFPNWFTKYQRKCVHVLATKLDMLDRKHHGHTLTVAPTPTNLQFVSADRIKAEGDALVMAVAGQESDTPPVDTDYTYVISTRHADFMERLRLLKNNTTTNNNTTTVTIPPPSPSPRPPQPFITTTTTTTIIPLRQPNGPPHLLTDANNFKP